MFSEPAAAAAPAPLLTVLQSLANFLKIGFYGVRTLI